MSTIDNEEENRFFLQTPVKFIKICQGKDFLQLSQIVIRNKDKINIAPFSKITCNSEDINAPLKNAIDGIEKCRDIPNIYHSKTITIFLFYYIMLNLSILY